MKRILIYTSISIFALALISACGGNKTKTTDEKVTEEGIEKPVKIEDNYDLLSQDGYEEFLTDWDIPIPQYADLDTVGLGEEKAFKIVYNMKPFNEDSVQTLYEEAIDKQLLENGWTKPMSGYSIQGTIYMNIDSQEYFKFFHMSLDEFEQHQIGFVYGTM